MMKVGGITMEKTQEYRQADVRLREAYAQIDATELDADVKTAVKAVIAIRQIVDWRTVGEAWRQVDSAIVKYIRASSAPDLPQLVHDVITKLPFDRAFRPALGEYIFDIYPQGEDQTVWQCARDRLKKETIPLVLLSKKFYQNTTEESIK
jgi:hypothetical protein